MTSTRRTRSDGRETIALIKKHALKELEKSGAVNFNLDRVIEESQVSRSSVYHHFGNRENLIAVISLDQSLQRIVDELKVVERLANQATTPAQMFDVLILGLTAGGSKEAQARRLRRVSGFAATDSNKAIHRAMQEAQVEGTAHFIRILQQAEERKLISPIVPIQGIAYLLQSMLVGRIVPDITESTDIDNDWLEASLQAIRHLLGTDSLP